MKYFVHPLGLCESSNVGEGTRIWAFAHVLSGARIGRDCNLCDHTFIENDVIVGDRVTVKSGVQLWDGLRVEDDVFVGPNVTFTNDPFPRSRRRPPKFKETRICSGASIGANATILPGLTIGPAAMIGAGAVITKSVPARAIVVGNPARIMGYVGSGASDLQALEAATGSTEPRVEATRVAGVTLHHLPLIQDLRGNLTVGEVPRDVPFAPQRYFMVLDVPSGETRGAHAHRQCQQFLLCVAGGCSIIVDNGQVHQEFRLDSPSVGLYIPPKIWAVQYQYSPDAVLLVLASHRYDDSDYIRDYGEFITGNRTPLPDEAILPEQN